MANIGHVSALDISASALGAQRRRMEVIAGNIANANTMTTPEGGPYRRHYVTFQTAMQQAMGAPGAGQVAGVQVSEVKVSNEPLNTVYDPQNPFADKNGFVQTPNISVTKEMVDMVSAQREYEANLSAMKSYREILRNSISILKR